MMNYVLLLVSAFSVSSALAAPDTADSSSSLCSVAGCDCLVLPPGSLVSLTCSCQGRQTLRLGAEHLSPPHNTVAILLENCHQVDLNTRIVNQLPSLRNITITNTNTLTLQPRIFDARLAPRSAEKAGELENIQLTNIANLIVKRYAMKDIRVTGRFYLGEVTTRSLPAMGLELSYVGEFSVFASKFERISMFGIVIGQCREFNILGMTTFKSLAAHAIKVKAEKFSLAYNWFGHLHDSSFDVEFGLCDIQGNTFHSLQGKPFISLKPVKTESQSLTMRGFVFRENKFFSEPVLPFGSLAMPHYSKLDNSSEYVDVEDNQFACNCLKIGWLLAFARFGHNSASLEAAGPGSPAFTREMLRSRGAVCLQCDGEGEQAGTERCHQDSAVSLADYAASALTSSQEAVLCADSGLEVRNYDKPTSQHQHQPDNLADVTVSHIKDQDGQVQSSTEENQLSVADQRTRDTGTGDTGDTGADNNERLLSSSEANRCLVVHNIIILYVIIWNSF